MTLAATVQSLQPGTLVELYEIDLTVIGVSGDDAIWRFVPKAFASVPVVFDGATYNPADVEATGFETNGRGTVPRPTLRVTNATLLLAGVVLGWQDAVGAMVTRRRTFSQYLDGGAEADPDARFKDEVWTIERKVSATKLAIEFQLGAPTDVEGVQLPRRTAVRDYCPWTYRRWTGSAFDYTDVECPYAGTSMFTWDGTATTSPTADVCGRKVSDCRLRFGADGILPFGGFPGVGRNTQGNGG